MSAYIIVRVDIEDWDAYGEYMLHTPRVVAKFGGRFIARGGDMQTLEGPEESLRLVLIEFPSLQHAEDFYESDEYSEIKQIRADAGEAQFVAIDGYPADEWEQVLAESLALLDDADTI